MESRNVEIVRILWAALDRDAGDPWPPRAEEEFDRRLRLDLFDEEVEIKNVDEFPVASEYRGHHGVRRWAIEVWEVFSELNHEILEMIEPDDETVVSVQRTRGRMRHTELEGDMTWAAVWEFRDGRVRRTQGFASRKAALEATGAAD